MSSQNSQNSQNSQDALSAVVEKMINDNEGFFDIPGIDETCEMKVFYEFIEQYPDSSKFVSPVKMEISEDMSVLEKLDAINNNLDLIGLFESASIARIPYNWTGKITFQLMSNKDRKKFDQIFDVMSNQLPVLEEAVNAMSIKDGVTETEINKGKASIQAITETTAKKMQDILDATPKVTHSWANKEEFLKIVEKVITQ